MKRRDVLAATVAIGSLKFDAEAQQPQQQPADLVELARRTMQTNREAINKVKLPMAVEPPFHFKA